ncbi:hypothetical protein H0H87_005156 [Tephrocybe sp. NHM501043]|nr:hypothetical protein H0H87_005156 [Tephrocybe sp. NHM501043]
MSTYTFTSKDIFTADLRAGHPSAVSYRLNTTKGFFLGLKITSLVPIGGFSDGFFDLPAVINWRDSTFEIGGVRKAREGLKQHAGGLFSSTRIWHWSSPLQSYTVSYRDKQWTVSHVPFPLTAELTIVKLQPCSI